MADRLPAYRLEDGYRVVSLQGSASTKLWEGMRSEEIGEGWRVNLFDFRVEEQEMRSIEGPATFSISIFLDGSGRLALDNGTLLEVRPGSLFLFHAPHPTRGLNQVNAGSRMRGIDFRFAPALMDRIELRSLSALMHAFSGNGSVQDVLLVSRPINAPLARIAEDVLACRMRGTARRVFLQSKALEVLAHVIAFGEPGESDASEGRLLSAGLSQREQQRVRQASELLRERYSEPWTIASLAREVGLNERKLKLGFRRLLDRTVHDCLERARLSAAQSLLAEEGLGVTETALAVGYSNPSHFAKIFKRHLGFSPSQWRRVQGGAASRPI